MLLVMNRLMGALDYLLDYRSHYLLRMRGVELAATCSTKAGWTAWSVP
jgi:hypothetical protein